VSEIDPEILAAIKAAAREALTDRVPEWLTPKEAAAYTKIPSGTLQKWRARNKGPPAYQISPRMFRYKRAELDAFITTCTPDENSK
jgi:excisionase family DNA binding protein